MDSPSRHHFPPIVFHEGEKYLWNRLERKPLVNRPEERVRLRYIDYLTLEAGWPKSRISAETPVNSSGSSPSLRTDLICFSKEFKPELLIECKAESVSLNQSTAEQIARYNLSIQAELLCITNGIQDYWYQLIEGKPVQQEHSPLQVKSKISEFRSHFSYWQERGCAGANPTNKLRIWLSDILPRFWSDDIPWDSRYLDIPRLVHDPPLSHYYRIIPLQDEKQLAVTFLKNFNGDSCLVAILNQSQKNRGILVVNLDQLFEGIESNSILTLPDGNKTLNTAPYMPADFQNPGPEFIHLLPDTLETAFSG